MVLEVFGFVSFSSEDGVKSLNLVGEYAEPLFVLLQIVLEDLVVFVFGNLVFQLAVSFPIPLLNFLYFFVLGIVYFLLSS